METEIERMSISAPTRHASDSALIRPSTRQSQFQALALSKSERVLSVQPTELEKFESFFGRSLSHEPQLVQPLQKKVGYSECMFDSVFGGDVNASSLIGSSDTI